MGDARDPVARRLTPACRATSLLEKTLFACDEMAGFITAASLVRPSKSVLDLEARSVIKRMKDKAFARAVKREDLRAGAELLGLPLEEHIAQRDRRSCASGPMRSGLRGHAASAMRRTFSVCPTVYQDRDA